MEQPFFCFLAFSSSTSTHCVYSISCGHIHMSWKISSESTQDLEVKAHKHKYKKNLILHNMETTNSGQEVHQQATSPNGEFEQNI